MKLALALPVAAAALALAACGHTDAGNNSTAVDNGDVLVNSDEGASLNSDGFDDNFSAGNASGLDNATAPLDAENGATAGNAQ